MAPGEPGQPKGPGHLCSDKMHPGAIFKSASCPEGTVLCFCFCSSSPRGDALSGLSRDVYHPRNTTVPGSDVNPQHGVSCVQKSIR